MYNRLNLRPYLALTISEMDTASEKFQNQTLRPILKLQNDLYMGVFNSYIVRQEKEFSTFTPEKKSIFTEQALQKDAALKNILIGITVGMFTVQELEIYSSNSREFNRRIMAMVTERIKSQL